MQPYQLPVWRPIVSRARGRTLELYVLQDALKSPDGQRFSVSSRDVQAWADELGALPTTEKIEDLSFAQAEHKLYPPTQDLYGARLIPKGAERRRYLDGLVAKQNAAIDAMLLGKTPALTRSVGKAWILHPRVTDKTAVNYGLHSKLRPVPKTGPFVSWNGSVVWQPASAMHNHDHGNPEHGDGPDYSQFGACLAFRSCQLDGETRDLEDIYRDPDLAELVSYSGALTRTRLV